MRGSIYQKFIGTWRLFYQKVQGLFCSQKLLLYINGSGTLPPPLTVEEENEVIARLSTDPEGARKILIERNLRLVVYIAKKFENSSPN